MTAKSYSIPVDEIVLEYIVKKSRFIAHVARAQSREQALAFLANVKQQHPEAGHHCWAYIIGPPEAAQGAYSDDGEPSGTAGKPILNVLQHKAIGDIMAIVTRYFGGVKLGAGGLVRAYGTATQQAIDQLTLASIHPTTELSLQFAFELEALVRRALEALDANIHALSYSDKVSMKISVQQNQVPELEERLQNMCKGAISIIIAS